MRKDGRKNAYALCPVCGGDKKLSISKEKKIVRCFKCEQGHGRGVWEGRADAIRFIMIVLKCHRGRALHELFTNVGPLPVEAGEADELDLNLPDEALLIGASCDEDHPCRQFLNRRGLARFVGDWYMCPTGHYHGRVIIPVKSLGEDWGFEAKSYIGAEPKSLANLREGAIYLSRQWDTERDYAVITESCFDAESISMNAVGLFGSALDENRLSTLLPLRRLGVTKLIWFLDGDAFDKQLSIIRKWTSLYFYNHRIRCPKGQDPNSLPMLDRWKLIQSAVPLNNAFDYADDLMGVRI